MLRPLSLLYRRICLLTRVLSVRDLSLSCWADDVLQLCFAQALCNNSLSQCVAADTLLLHKHLATWALLCSDCVPSAWVVLFFCCAMWQHDPPEGLQVLLSWPALSESDTCALCCLVWGFAIVNIPVVIATAKGSRLSSLPQRIHSYTTKVELQHHHRSPMLQRSIHVFFHLFCSCVTTRLTAL
jgi:hypothetical protein